jgi:hypothetical protein
MAGVARRLSRQDFVSVATAAGLGGLLAAGAAGDTTTSTPIRPRPLPDPTDVLVTRWRQDPHARPILVGFNATTAADQSAGLTDDQVGAEAMAAPRAMYADG